MEENKLALEKVLAVGWHPSGISELAPTLRDGEIISVIAFHCLWLDLPLHPFVRGLLFFYDLRLHDLTLEGVLHNATFITLCEALLGIAPHFAIWRCVWQVVTSFPGGVFSAMGGCSDLGASACYWLIPCPCLPVKV
jgi:hypothetical protein